MAVACLGALLCSCASNGESATQLCEIELSIVHFPHLIQSTQKIDEEGVSHFMCTLSTDDSTLGDIDHRELLEPECRRFMREAMSAATECSSVRFKPGSGFVELEPVEGTDVNGPFFALKGLARRITP